MLKALLILTVALAMSSTLVAAELDENGCRILSPLPKPGVHPRVFFTADEYPAMRERLATPHFRKMFGTMRQQAVDSCRKGQWRRFADVDFAARGVKDEDIIEWFKPGEGRNIQWGVASVHSMLVGDKELQAVMRRMIVKYAHVILASKKRSEGDLDGPLAKQLKQSLKIWTHNRWDVGVGWTFGAAGYTASYDVLYGTMSAKERSTVARAIAAATTGRKSYGNGMPPGFATSNHYGYHGDLAVMMSAIEGEPGFDQETWDGICQVLRDYWEKGFTTMGYSREDGYGPNLGLRGGGRGYMVLARRGYNIFATRKYRQFLEYLAMDWDPFPGGHLNGGASGGPYTRLYPTSILMTRFMYPKNPCANFVWRHVAGDDYEGRVAWQGLLDYMLYGSDWRGPKDRKEMLASSGLKLSVFYPVRGKYIARSDWSGDAMYLTFDARPDAHLIGHDKVDRGNFSMSALGRVWAASGDFHTHDSSTENSLVHIDGKAQAWKAPSVRFLWHGDTGTIAGAGADLKYAYDWQWTPPWPKWGREFAAPWEPETNSPYDLGWPKEYPDADLCPDSLHGSQTGYAGRNNLHRQPYNKVAEAVRFALLVRGKRPYAIICDDIKKDGAEHKYEWYMQLPLDLRVKSNEGNGLILAEEEGGREMLVRFMQEGKCAFVVEKYVVAEDKRRKTVTRGQRLIASLTCVEPRFRVLLYPYNSGDPVPQVTGRYGSYTITIGDQIDKLEMTDATGRTGDVAVTREQKRD